VDAFGAQPSFASILAFFDIRKKDNSPLMGNSKTGKTHLATALGLTACQQRKNVRFLIAGELINQLAEAQAGVSFQILWTEKG